MVNYRLNKDKSRVSVKLYEKDVSFKKSIIIPTDYYPTNKYGDFLIFTSQNTKSLHNEGLIKIIDRIKYKMGCCYQNTEKIISLASQYGYNLTSYCGWLFVDNNNLPIHHCWCMYEDSLIDLSDCFGVTCSSEVKNNLKVLDSETSRREYMIDLLAKAAFLKNSERCKPLGLAHESLLYVGFPCSPSDGRKQYNDLIRKYPNHEIHMNVGNDNRTETQRILSERGIK